MDDIQADLCPLGQCDQTQDQSNPMLPQKHRRYELDFLRKPNPPNAWETSWPNYDLNLQ
jgi:hypothetical protein